MFYFEGMSDSLVESESPFSSSLGSYLCVHQPGEPFEDIDRVSVADLKQEACLRAIIALRRAGQAVGPGTDPIAAFDAEAGLVRRAYQYACRDALRQQLGRGMVRGGRLARWQRRMSLDHGFDEVADPRQGEELDAVVEEMVAIARVGLLWSEGLAGVSANRTRRLIRLLQRLQRRREEGIIVVPDHVRQQLRLLRAATGLRIDVREL